MHCQISKIPFYYGDKVVALLLEPGDGNYSFPVLFESSRGLKKPKFAVASGLLHGEIGEYGFEVTDPSSAAHGVVQETHGTRLDRDSNHLRESAGSRLSLGGDVSDYEERTQLWMIHESVYEALLSAFESSNSVENYENLFLPEVYDLLSEAGELASVQRFLHIVRQMGVTFEYPNGVESRQHLVTVQSRAEFVGRSTATGMSDGPCRFYSCAVSGVAISAGEDVQVVLLEPKPSRRQNPIHANNFDSRGLYGLCSHSFPAVICENGDFKPRSDLTKYQSRGLSLCSGVGGPDQLEESIALLNQGTFYFNVGLGDSCKDVCVIKKEIYDDLVEKGKSRNVFWEDCNIWCEVFLAIKEAEINFAIRQSARSLLSRFDTLVDVDFIFKENERYRQFFGSKSAGKKSLSENLRDSLLRSVCDSLYMKIGKGVRSNEFLGAFSQHSSNSLAGPLLKRSLDLFLRAVLNEKDNEVCKKIINESKGFFNALVEDARALSAIEDLGVTLRPSLRSMVEASPKKQAEVMHKIHGLAQEMAFEKSYDNDLVV